MFTRQHHLSDDRLIEVCLDGASAAPEQHHLEICAACEARRAHMAALFTDVARVTSAEADVVFTGERLAKQQVRILQRIEQDGRPGRVISFPAAGHAPAASMRVRPGMRWVAGAAAAGLVIGLLAGHLAHDLPMNGPAPASDMIPAAATLQAVSIPLSEEEFLGRLELATEGTSGSTLQPLDDLTPRVWEVAAQ